MTTPLFVKTSKGYVDLAMVQMVEVHKGTDVVEIIFGNAETINVHPYGGVPLVPHAVCLLGHYSAPRRVGPYIAAHCCAWPTFTPPYPKGGT